MTELDHNNLVRIYGVSTKGSMLIIAELCHHGSLKDYLQGRFDKTDLCEESTLRRFAFDVCLGMQYVLSDPRLHVWDKSFEYQSCLALSGTWKTENSFIVIWLRGTSW